MSIPLNISWTVIYPMDIAVHAMSNFSQFVCRIAVTEHTYITLYTVTYNPNINAHIISD